MACGGWMNCVVYSITRRVFHATRTSGEQDTPPTRSGKKNDGSGGTVTEMSLLESLNSDAYRDRPSTVEATDSNITVGKSVKLSGHSDPYEGVQMARTWEVRTEEVQVQHTKTETYRLGHRVSVSY